jgi:hypothetical protein
MEPMTTAWPGRVATAVDFEAADARRFGTYSWPYGTARGRASADACAGSALAIRGEGLNGPALRVYGTGRIGRVRARAALAAGPSGATPRTGDRRFDRRPQR